MSQRTYKRINEDEFEAFLDEMTDKLTTTWKRINDDDSEAMTKETVYAIPLSIDRLQLRVYSTLIDGVSRNKGDDAIRTVIFDTKHNTVIGGREKTLRIETWRKNLAEKIEQLYRDWRDHTHGECPKCDGVLVERDGEYGTFAGCSNYPRCKHTMSTHEDVLLPILDDHHQWVYGTDEWHVFDSQSLVCGESVDDLTTTFAPDVDEVPQDRCTECFEQRIDQVQG